MLLHAIVHAADIQDRDGGVLLLATLFGLFPFLKKLFADRASSATMQANQLRMSFSAMAYVLVDTLRRVGLRHSQFADAAVANIRLKLLKLGALVRTSVRRIHFAIASGCPNKDEFELAYVYLQRAFSSA